MPDGPGLNLAGGIVTPAHTLDMGIPLEVSNLCMQMQCDGRILLNAPDQIPRHAFRKATRPDEYMHVLSRAGEKNGGLARRVPATHHNHLFSITQLRLHE